MDTPFLPSLFFVAGEKEVVAGPGLLPKGSPPNDSWSKNKKGTTNRGKKTLRRYNPAHTRGRKKRKLKENKTQSQK